MSPSSNSSGSTIADIIENRSPAGTNESVQGWHKLLKRILFQMSPYLREGHMVTFRRLTDQESVLFEKLRQKISVPPSAASIYMPPSVRYQMLYNRPVGDPQPIPEHSSSRKNDFNVVINALLAKTPFTPAIDVYDDGKLLAGYIYNTIDECIGNLTKVLQVHLQSEADQG